MSTELREVHVERTEALAARVYRSLYRIRRVEEEVARVYPTDVVKSPVHLSIGQEAVAVGICEALQPTDVAFGTYRGHAVYLAKGGDLRQMIAELYGKAGGGSRGKGGSMHLIDVAHGVMGMSAVVGTTIPHAAGYALAMKMRRRDTVVASFFGDGATEEGVYYETLNFAALKQLPVLFVCENNGYAIHAPLSVRQTGSIAQRAAAFGIPARRLDDDDVFAILAAAREEVALIRRGQGPRFLECPTYRWKEHVGPRDDSDLGYRALDELNHWKSRDQVAAVAAALPDAARGEIERSVEDEIREAFEFAEASPFPPDSELWTDVYAG